MKTCIVCGESSPTSAFPVRKASKDGHTSKCFTCTRDYNRRDYAENRPARFSKNNAFRVARVTASKQYIKEYFVTHHCVDCGESDPVVLDFDHVRGVKRNHVSEMVKNGSRLALIIEEITKCEVRCANDHRRITHARRIAGYSEAV